MNTKKYIYALASLVFGVFLVLALPVFAMNNNNGNRTMARGHFNGQMGRMQGQKQGMGIFGTVATVNGNTITVTSKTAPNSTTTASYTVDATNATVTKNNATSTVSSIAIGDIVSVRGTVNGTNVVSNSIRDGQMIARNPIISGDGQPVVAGTVSAVSGQTVTITNKSNVQYAIDATKAKIIRGRSTINISDIRVGDSVVAQGTVNGTSVIASSIIDESKPANITANSKNIPAGKTNLGFLGSIGQFFSHLFGF